MKLYYVALNANDSIKDKLGIPPGFKGKRFLLAVEAEDDESAGALILDSFGALAPKKDFGEVMLANRHKNGWWFDIPE